MRLRVGARTDTGRVRALNEDVYVSRPEQGLFVVCDGMGGAPCGEVASQVAVETILEQLEAVDEEAAVETGADGCSYLPRTNRLAQAVRRSNQVIYDQGRNDPRQAEMGTTVVGAWVTQHIASVAHVGDSRAYLFHDNHLEQLTQDHSLVEAEVGAGLLDRERSLQSDHQNILLKVLGGAPDVEVELIEVPLQPGDYLLLCSDGLTRMVPERTLTQAIAELQNPRRICDYLIDAANRNGGADNITVIVVEVVDRWWRRLANRWNRQPGRGHDAEAHSAA
jgi:serine/threonine protein phosphatase PrpC